MMQVLVVEDSETQLAELHAILEHVRFSVHPAATLAAACATVQREACDAILLDLGLPDGHGLPVLARMRSVAPDVPIVVLTGLDDEETAVQAVQQGAQDYLIKGEVNDAVLIRCLRYAVERKQAEIALRRSHDDLATILNQLRVGTMMLDGNGCATFVSRTCKPYLTAASASCAGVAWRELLPLSGDDALRLENLLRIGARERERLSVKIESPSGRPYWVDIEVLDDPEDPQRRILTLYDVSEVRDLRRLLDERVQFQDLVGRSTPMLRLYELVRQVASVDTTVLIDGATGTGKELVAKAIHSLSVRSKGPFITVNSAGLTDSLLASQLFGHRRGAFTGAVSDHKGFFEVAEGGTIFLDEIGDIPPPVQMHLLRVLQEREILRVGDSVPRKVNVRVVAATHRDLARAVEEGTFRADLFYRIRIARVHLPALRERREDIPLLVNAFLAELSSQTGKHVESVSAPAMGMLLEYGWPGNVRELRGALEFAVIRATGPVLRAEDLPPEIERPVAGPTEHAVERGRERRTDELSSKEVLERERILEALRQANGNRTVAAQILGIGRATFYRRLESLNIAIDE